MRRIAEWMLLVLGTLLLGLFAAAHVHRELGAAQARAALEEAARARHAHPAAASRAAAAAAPMPGQARFAVPEPDTTLWSGGRLAAWLETLTGPAAEPLALLEIPSIGLAVAVLVDTDAWSLNRGVGHIPGTALPGDSGNAGIAGHRDGFFRGLAHVAPGDDVILTLPDGASLRYRIQWTRVVRPEEVSVLDATPEVSLTLVTCYPFYFVGSAPERWIVRAVQREERVSRAP